MVVKRTVDDLSLEARPIVADGERVRFECDHNLRCDIRALAGVEGIVDHFFNKDYRPARFTVANLSSEFRLGEELHCAISYEWRTR
jgi:hypothetical protein